MNKVYGVENTCYDWQLRYIYILPDPENPSSPRLRIYRSYVEAIILAILAIRDRALFGTYLPAAIVYLPIFAS